ncbi:MAG: phosphatase PAP2 family protein [Oscillospiraceae bacterium]|nr:phosphatase PAP2 family protein [Oscillospiraceae bacterium]
MGASAAALWINSFFASFDESITLAIHNLLYPMRLFFTPFFDFISLLGKGGIFLIILSLVMIFFKRTRRMGTAMLIAVTVGALFTNCCLKVLIARPRPYTDETGVFYRLWLLVGQHTESDKSFPSGHTTAAFATMTALFLTGNRRISWTAYIFAFFMAIARIYLVVHYPSDVLAGIFVGTAAGLIGVLITMKIPKKWFDLEFIRSTHTQSGQHEKRDAV